jgi:hypothetical protein
MSLPNNYVLMKIESCPRCGQKGSLHLKTIENKVHHKYKYYYVAHYDKNKRGIHWCYISKTLSVSLLCRKPDVGNVEIIGEAEESMKKHGKMIVQRGKSPCFLVVEAN